MLSYNNYNKPRVPTSYFFNSWFRGIGHDGRIYRTTSTLHSCFKFRLFVPTEVGEIVIFCVTFPGWGICCYLQDDIPISLFAPSAVDCERGFSLMNSVKTSSRNMLRKVTVHDTTTCP